MDSADSAPARQRDPTCGRVICVSGPQPISRLRHPRRSSAPSKAARPGVRLPRPVTPLAAKRAARRRSPGARHARMARGRRIDARAPLVPPRPRLSCRVAAQVEPAARRPGSWRASGSASIPSTRHGRKVSLGGWSLGGIYARELARCYIAAGSWSVGELSNHRPRSSDRPIRAGEALERRLRRELDDLAVENNRRSSANCASEMSLGAIVTISA